MLIGINLKKYSTICWSEEAEGCSTQTHVTR